MRLQFLDTALWAAGPLLNAALFGVLYLRRRLWTFPVLAAWCLFTILSTAALFFIYRMAGSSYAFAYWIVDGLDVLFQIGVVAEVARIVFAPHRSAGVRLSWLLAGTVIASLAIVWWVHPVSLTRTGVWEIRGDLFTSLVVAGTFTFVLLSSQRRGMHWRSHVMSIGYGLMVWAVVTLIVGLLHGYWGRNEHYLAVEHLRMLVYLAILLYWIVALWRDEPETEQPSPEMRDAILQLTDKVSYDLAKALGTREKEFH
jgi:hypothetical protein